MKCVFVPARCFRLQFLSWDRALSCRLVSQQTQIPCVILSKIVESIGATRQAADQITGTCCQYETYPGMSKSSVVMEDVAADVTRQAELVVMDCLKSWNCPRALAAFMEKSSGSGMSAIASERFSDDMEAKKKATEERTSLLEYMISAASESKDLPSSSNRRRSSSGTKESETDTATEWTKEEISALKKAIKKTSAVEDKNARWKQIAGLVGNGRTKKHCYLKYKELKQEQTNAAAKKASPRRKRPSDDKPKHNAEEVETAAAKSDTKVEADDGKDSPKSTDLDSPLEVDPPASKEFEEPPAAFVASRRAVAPLVKTFPTSSEALEVEDCEDLGEFLRQPTTDSRARAPTTRSIHSNSSSCGTTRILTSSDVAAVQQLLFGATKKTFSSHWEEQGFEFSTVRNLQYGLVQHQGGPCGILAVVQAYVLRFLLQRAPADWKNPDLPHQEAALVQALAHILWQAAKVPQHTECVVAVKGEETGGQRRFMAGLKLHVASSEEQARQLIAAHLPQFMEPKGSGLVQFVLSVLLTKGVEGVKSDMDQLAGGQLIGAHDYCTQEIVNLLLCGSARSNVFNGEQVLEGDSASDTIVLHGISSQSEVGFLSLFEAYQNLVVGSHLKQPRVNVWVVCSESHYSVLLVADPLDLENRAFEARRTLDLLYYDGLANQDEEIRLTVDTCAHEERLVASHEDLVPPLNLVIRTKWPHAAVDWHGVEPLL